MSALLELSSKLSEIKTEIKNILGTHNITVTDNDSIDYYLEKLKTLKIVNQNKNIYLSGEYEAEEGYSGFGKINIQMEDYTVAMERINANTYRNTNVDLSKYNMDNPSAEYIADPTAGPEAFSFDVNNTYTGSTVYNVKFNNIQQFSNYWDMYKAGYNYVQNMYFPDLAVINLNAQGAFYTQSSSYQNALVSINLPVLKVISPKFEEYCLAYQLKNLQTINAPNIKTLNNRIAYQCPALINVNMDNLETYNTPNVYNGAIYACSNIETIYFPKLKNFIQMNYSNYYGIAADCPKLKEINCPELENIQAYGIFYNCSNMEKIVLPKLKKIDSSNFMQNYGNIKYLDFRGMTDIGNNIDYTHSFMTGTKSKLEYANFSSLITVNKNLDRLNNNYSDSQILFGNFASSSTNNCVLYFDNLEEYIGHTATSCMLLNNIGKLPTISFPKLERFDNLYYINNDKNNSYSYYGNLLYNDDSYYNSYNNTTTINVPLLESFTTRGHLVYNFKYVTTINFNSLQYIIDSENMPSSFSSNSTYYGFYNCPELVNLNISNLKKINKDKVNYTLIYNAPKLTSINLNNLEEFYCDAYTKYNDFAPSNCLFFKTGLTNIILPKLKLCNGMLCYNTNAQIISLPALETMYNDTTGNYYYMSFDNTYTSSFTDQEVALTTLHFKDLTTLKYFCYLYYAKYKNFSNLILEGDHIVSLPTNWLTSSNDYLPMFYKHLANIYVPNDLVDDYKKATNWSTMSDMIKPLSDYNDVNNIITRHNGYLDINITQTNCKTYYNGRDVTPYGGIKPLISYNGNIPIDENNIATISGGNSTNYLQLSGFPINGALLLKIKFTQWNNGNLFLEDSSGYARFGIHSNTHKLSEYPTSNYNSATTINLNTWYWLRFRSDGTNIICHSLLDNGYTTTTLPTSGWTQENTFSRTNWWSTYNTLYIGKSAYYNETFKGEVDLNSIIVLDVDSYREIVPDQQHLTNLPFYPNKDYGVLVVNENYPLYSTTLNYNDTTRKTLNVDLSTLDYVTLNITTNVEDPNITFTVGGFEFTNRNSINVGEGSVVTYTVKKKLYQTVTGTVTVTENTTINVDLEYVGQVVTVNLNPGKTSYGWKTPTYTNPKSGDGWIMYQSNNAGAHSTSAVMKVMIEGFDTFTCYINSYAEGGCDYTYVSALDSESYSTVYNNYSTVSKQYTPTTFNTTNWTTVTFTGLNGGEHYFYVTYRKDGSVNSNYDAGFFLYDPNQ